jgi:L-threonylcarbamoyladenylate synthase
VQEELGEFLGTSDQILDGGNSVIGIESTIIDCTEYSPTILRSGFITREDIERELRVTCLGNQAKSDLKFSGSFEKHYSPKCKILLGESDLENAAFFALSSIQTPIGMERLGAPRTIEDFARTMYSTFRLADQREFPYLVVISPVGDGIVVAIKDRLLKASSGR